ncbi:hypothetical protein TL16_g04201 [Triparma laevis f. inornata]|uniref:RGS domain-containing protein n=1 Tax=Triparma laevis f. inornata TaxID=1714386 RepID=A0A9W7E4I4_9STRA|nr:hypothetical protein TL16_g04201 [Triparma laevis f. inornata]
MSTVDTSSSLLPLSDEIRKQLFNLKISQGFSTEAGKRISSETVIRVLEDSECRSLLESFLTKEFAEESFNFYTEVTEFKEIQKDKIWEASNKLFGKFVKQGSEQQINVPAHMVKTCKTKLDSAESDKSVDINIDIFDDCLKEVVAMLARDKLPRFIAEVASHRQDILISNEEKHLKLKIGEMEATLSNLSINCLCREVLKSLQSTTQAYKLVHDINIETEGKFNSSVLKCNTAKNWRYSENDVDYKEMVVKVKTAIDTHKNITTLYNELSKIASSGSLLESIGSSVQLNNLTSQLRTFTVLLFQAAANVFRIVRCKDELEVMKMIDFFYLQVQANDFVKEDGLKGPIGPMEMTVMVCRDNLATPEVRARLLEALQSNVGVWAGVSMKEFGDWNYPESIKTEGIWAKTLEKGDMDAFMDEYRVLCDGIDPVFSPAPQEKETSVKLIMKFMKSTSVDEVNKKKVKSGKWRQGLFTEQGCLLSEIVNTLTLENKEDTREEGTAPELGKRVQIVLEVLDDFFRWSTVMFAVINAKIHPDAISNSSFEKLQIEKLCSLASDSMGAVQVIKKFMKSTNILASPNSSPNNNKKDKLAEDIETIQQKIEILTLQAHKAREGVSELASYISQCIFEKRINRYYYTDHPHEHHGFHLHEHKKVGVLTNGIGGALIDSIFKAFDDIEGGATAVKISFGRVIETLLEHLTNVKCGFSTSGAKKLLKDIEIVLDWAKTFDHKHGTDCALSPALDRAHAILVILTEPSTSVRTPELLLCIEQLPDLDVWLALRSDRGRGKGAGGGRGGVATLSGGHISGHLSTKDSEKSKREPKVKIKISKRIMQVIRDSDISL